MTVRNVMIDLETLGVTPGCIVLSIGACTFDQRDTFYNKISVQLSREGGFSENMDTVRWWAKQPVAVRDEAMSGVLSPLIALNAFSDWMAGLEHRQNLRAWGNGADFDIPILRAYYDKYNIATPWGPFAGRCYRTLKELLPHITPHEKNKEKHNALADAIYQAQHAQLLLNSL